ncbi:MAG: BMP family ABC transporter substrate-binding protein, partial [Lachnospiraceae bacterium]|nr:BMP family ABC transporter substrate-binding protein [Lachnospiraceae bacterium]
MTMKRIRLGLAGLALVCIMAGCGKTAEETASSADDAEGRTEQESEEEEESGSGMEMTSWQESVHKMFEDPYGDYTETGGEIVLLTDGPVEDGGYNEAVYNGVRMYALGAGKSFSYYNADIYEPESYYELMERSAQDGARIIVCAGNTFGGAVGAMQETYPQTSFLLIDSVPHDAEG